MAKTEFRIDGKPSPDHSTPKDLMAGKTPEDAKKPEAEMTLKEKAIEALKTVYDPEIPLNIYDLGLIYDVDVQENNHVKITMTLTSPACPVAENLPLEARAAVERVPEVNGTEVDLTFDPPWSQDNLSDEAKLALGLL